MPSSMECHSGKNSAVGHPRFLPIAVAGVRFGVAGLAFGVTIITGTNVAPSSAGSVNHHARRLAPRKEMLRADVVPADDETVQY